MKHSPELLECKNGPVTLYLHYFRFPTLTLCGVRVVGDDTIYQLAGDQEVFESKGGAVSCMEFIRAEIQKAADTELRHFLAVNMDQNPLKAPGLNRGLLFRSLLNGGAGQYPKPRQDGECWFSDILNGRVLIQYHTFCFQYDLMRKQIIDPKQESVATREWINAKSTLLELFYSPESLAQALYQSQHSQGKAPAWYGEIIRLSDWLRGKKRVHIALKDDSEGYVIESSGLTAASILNYRESGGKTRLILSLGTDVTGLERLNSLRHGKSVYRIDPALFQM